MQGCFQADVAEVCPHTYNASCPTERITPSFECAKPLNESATLAYWGYHNEFPTPVDNAYGPTNYFVPPPGDLGQPDLFQPGMVPEAFTTLLVPGQAWNLGFPTVGVQGTAYANGSEAFACPSCADLNCTECADTYACGWASLLSMCVDVDADGTPLPPADPETPIVLSSETCPNCPAECGFTDPQTGDYYCKILQSELICLKANPTDNATLVAYWTYTNTAPTPVFNPAASPNNYFEGAPAHDNGQVAFFSNNEPLVAFYTLVPVNETHTWHLGWPGGPVQGTAVASAALLGTDSECTECSLIRTCGQCADAFGCGWCPELGECIDTFDAPYSCTLLTDSEDCGGGDGGSGNAIGGTGDDDGDGTGCGGNGKKCAERKQLTPHDMWNKSWYWIIGGIVLVFCCILGTICLFISSIILAQIPTQTRRHRD